jgi:hypothetical protein
MRILKSFALLLLMFSVLPANAADELPKGTKITVRIKSTLNSDNVTPGDTFEATLDHDLIVNGKTIAAEGATVRGRVDTSDSSNGGQTSGLLIIQLTEVETKEAIYNFTTTTYTRQGHARTGPRNRPGNIADTIGGIGRPTNPGDVDMGGSIGRGSGPAALIPAESIVTFRTTSAAKIESK